MSPMLDMSQMLAFSLILLLLYIGDVITTATKAWIPSVFVCAVLFLLGYWSFFPQDIVERAGIGKVVAVLLMYLLITNMGTLLSLKELRKQWKTIVITLSGIAGIILFCLVVGYLCFDLNTVIVAIPPLVGGIVSAIIMSDGAKAAGLIDLSVFAIVIYVMQGFAGYPLTAIALKREGRQLLAKIQQQGLPDEPQIALPQVQHTEIKAGWLQKIPAQYNSNYFKFLRLGLVSYLAYLSSVLLAPIVSISPFVLCLLFGVIAASVGFLERQPLKKANGFGFAVMALMMFIFDTLHHATPAMLQGLVWPLLVLILSAVVGMFIFTLIVGKILKVSSELAFAVALTALYGFPADYIITNEVINNLTEDEKERQALTNHLLPPMLIGGFISVTIVSVILAGIMVNMITPAG